MVPCWGFFGITGETREYYGGLFDERWRGKERIVPRRGRKEARFPKIGLRLGAGQGRYFAHRKPKTPNLPDLP